MADYALAVDLGAEVTAAISDDEGPRVVPIGDADQLTMLAAVDAAGRLLVGDAAGCDALMGEGISGQFHVLRSLSDSKPVATQGPVWYVGGQAV